MKFISFKSSILTGNFAISSFNLKFQDTLVESDYRKKLIEYIIPLNRVALILGFCMYTFFLFLDYYLVPESFWIQTTLRLIGSSLILMSLILSFFPIFQKYQEVFISIPDLLCGHIHFIMLLVSNLPADYVRSALCLMLLFTYYFTGLRLFISFWVAHSFLIFYIFHCIFIGKIGFFDTFYQNFWILATNTIGLLSAYVIEYLNRRSYVQGLLIQQEKKQAEIEKGIAQVAQQETERERQKSEKLLLNILPEEVALELKENGSTLPVLYDSVTVLFTDFKGFTQIAEGMTPNELVTELDGCFRQFDKLIERFNLEKLKTIGDSYMCAGGIPKINKTHALDAILAALEIQAFMNQMKSIKEMLGFPYWELRLGIHSGPLVAGVIGEKKFAYDVWGDTVNTASRMESSGTPGKINISGFTYQIVKDFFKCEYRGKVNAKSKGEIDMYYVLGIKDELVSSSENISAPNELFWHLYSQFQK